LWSEQREGLEQELIHLRAAIEDGSERLEAAQQELAAGDATHHARLERVTEAQLELSALEVERRTRSQHLVEAQDFLLDLRTQSAEKRSLLLQLQGRRSELARADADQAQGAEAAARQLSELEHQLATSDEQIGVIQAELALLAQARLEQEAALTKGQQAERAARQQLDAAQRGLGRLQDQQDLLTRLRDEGAGLAAGPRAIVAARGQLEGIIGPLGDLIEVSPELERPIEAAMGGRLQDIVVRRWEDAESAVAFLKQNRGGRATFLPRSNTFIERSTRTRCGPRRGSPFRSS
jgi:chromosome segregation protein